MALAKPKERRFGRFGIVLLGVAMANTVMYSAALFNYWLWPVELTIIIVRKLVTVIAWIKTRPLNRVQKLLHWLAMIVIFIAGCVQFKWSTPVEEGISVIALCFILLSNTLYLPLNLNLHTSEPDKHTRLVLSYKLAALHTTLILACLLHLVFIPAIGVPLDWLWTIGAWLTLSPLMKPKIGPALYS
ncbi:hypothetical protein BDF22DRAFT_746375 [Syncephalis plumigaleata]|nr:hypothetical protein BDF22DRAFT_746375 [Syncephalis plumigaleata]